MRFHKLDQAVGLKLLQLREQKFISQVELAELMHVSPLSISEIESGNFRLSAIVRYVEALGGQLHIQVEMPDSSIIVIR